MSAGSYYILLIVAMGCVTYLPRLVPLALLSRNNIPRWLAEWLEFIPPAILSALLAPTLFVSPSPRVLTLGKIELLAAVPALLCAVFSRSLAATVVVGMLSYWCLTALF